MNAENLYKSPNALSPRYSRFCVADRLLLTGHSHQAWPDCGFQAQQQAWLDTAEHVDEKWDRAFAKADRVRRGFGQLIDDRNGHIALGANTHELVVRFLSALPLDSRPRLVTTDGEFHTIRRQLDRLHEERLEIVKVAALPASIAALRGFPLRLRRSAQRAGRSPDSRRADVGIVRPRSAPRGTRRSLGRISRIRAARRAEPTP